MLKTILFFLISLCTVKSFAQPKVRLSSEALSVVISGGNEFAAVTTADSLFVYRLPELTIYKKSKHQLRYPVLKRFAASSFQHPDMNDVLVLQENNLNLSASAYNMGITAELDKYNRTAYGEKLKDSISLWSISKERVISKLAGNYHFDFFTFREMGVFAMNYISNAYLGMDGDSVFTSKKAAILSQWDTEKSMQTEINAVVKRLVTCPVNLSFAIITQDPASSKYRVTVKKTETHKTLFESAEMERLPAFLEYSSDGKKLLFAYATGFRSSVIQVGDIYKNKIMQTIPVADDLTNLAFANYDSAVGYATPSVWVRWNLQDARIEKQISGTAFFSGFKLFDAIPAENYLFVHTQAMSEMGMALPQSELQLTPLEDFAVFANVEKGGTETVSLFEGYNMQLNDLPDFFDLRFNPEKTHFTVIGNNNKRLQVWDARRRKKLLDKYFTDRIDGFVDASGRFVWVIEYKDGDASRYRLRHIDLKTGVMTSSDQLVATHGSFKNNSSLVQAIAVPGEPNAWYVNDEDNYIWKFKGSQITPEKYEFDVPGFRAVRTISLDDKGNIYANIYNSNTQRTIIQVDFARKAYKIIAEGEFSSPQPYREGLLFESGNNVVFLKDGKMEHKISVDGKLIRFAIDKKLDRMYVQLIRDDGTDVLRIIDPGGKTTDHILKERLMGMDVLDNGELMYIAKGIKTFVDDKADPISWDASLPKSNAMDHASVSASGRYILNNKLIIDLQAANRYPTDPFAQTVFVKGKDEMERIELFSKGWNKDKYFSIRRISGADTVFSDTKISIPPDILSGYQHNILELSPDGNWAITATNVFETDEKRAGPILWNVKTLQGFSFPEMFRDQVPFFSSDSTRIFLMSDVNFNQELMVNNYSLHEFALDEKKGFSFIKKAKNSQEPPVSGEYNFQLSEFTSIIWYEPRTTKVKKSFYSAANMHAYAFSKEKQLLFAGTSNGMLQIWDINGASSPLQTTQVTNDQVKDIKIAGDKVYIFSVTSNIAIYSIAEKKLLANIQFIDKAGEQKLAMYTPDKFFNVDPEAVESLHFVKQGEIFPLSSYELQGNRPDKVYKAFGFADKLYIETLQKGWQTRLKRVGVKPSESFLASRGPELDWDRGKLSLISAQPTLGLSFTATDTSRSTLNKLLITVNGVPLGRRTGIAIPADKSSYKFERNIQLSSGKNRISVIAINSKGEESIEETHEVYYLPKQKPSSKIMYVGVGVSKYLDSSKNLVYAAKDVKDIAARLKYFADTVITHTLTDVKATKEGIMSVKKLLSNTVADDVVILSFSGHGMIDSTSGFLFAPHDMDFNKPSLNGISMTMIEDLLDDIPARKKLLLVDACHSGEQLEGLGSNATLPEGVKEVNTKGNEKIKRKEDKEKETDRKGYMMMKELFSDFSRGNGAFMISAAASNEFALESKQWNNGVFTASFLEALYEVKEQSADKKIRVRELRKAIYEKVKARTKGQQTPTSRQENGWWNWSF